MRIIICCICILMPLNASSFELSPMVAFFSEYGNGSEKIFQIKNTANHSLPVEITVKKRAVKNDENEVLTESGDFFVFPPQVLIPMGETQMIKVKYIGSSSDVTKSYRIIFSQLPIGNESDRSNIKVLFRMGALVFVSPENVEKSINTKVFYNNGKPTDLLIENSGTDVITLSDLVFDVQTSKNTYKWKWEAIKHLLPLQFLVPGQFVKVPLGSLLSSEEDKLLINVKGLR